MGWRTLSPKVRAVRTKIQRMSMPSAKVKPNNSNKIRILLTYLITWAEAKKPRSVCLRERCFKRAEIIPINGSVKKLTIKLMIATVTATGSKKTKPVMKYCLICLMRMFYPILDRTRKGNIGLPLTLSAPFGGEKLPLGCEENKIERLRPHGQSCSYLVGLSGVFSDEERLLGIKDEI